MSVAWSGGSLVGLLAVALPLTVGAGNAQLTAVIDNAAVLSTWLLLAVLVGKMARDGPEPG